MFLACLCGARREGEVQESGLKEGGQENEEDVQERRHQEKIVK
jgi:hypothetical protein